MQLATGNWHWIGDRSRRHKIQTVIVVHGLRKIAEIKKKKKTNELFSEERKKVCSGTVGIGLGLGLGTHSYLQICFDENFMTFYRQ